MHLAIIGCGAVTRNLYLPAIQMIEGLRVTLLVDKNRSQAEELARQYNVPFVSETYTDVYGIADAAIIALPHHLHASVSIELLRKGIHVLVEKPMALTYKECEAMISAAKEGGAVLAVGLMRRFLHAARWVKAVIDSGLIGKIESFDFQEGNVYNWPVASDFFFRKESAGGGVLIDMGAHTLDLLLWWLGDVEEFSYQDDSYGGIEADCELQLVLKSGAKGIVKLSRMRNLRNTAIIQGQKGKLEVSLRGNHITAEPPIILAYKVGKLRGDNLPSQSTLNLFVAQLKDWTRAITTGSPPFVTGEEGARVIALIEVCYRYRRQLSFPWVIVRTNETKPKIPTGTRVLVTGATGFIGGRLVEKLVLEHKAQVRALVRNFTRAPRIARFPVEMIKGDITDEQTINRAIEGCEIVFHCAHDFSDPPKNLLGTFILANACLKQQIRRVVYVSSFSVYEPLPDGDIDESTPMRPYGWEYVNNKRAIEKELLQYTQKDGLPVIILQPTIVYGPFSKVWTDGIVSQLRTSRVVLPDSGEGLCNAVYVDDVVDALLLAATADEEIIGERFLVSGNEPITWREFFNAYERILGVRRVILISTEEILQLLKGQCTPVKLMKTDPRRFWELQVPRILRKVFRLLIPKSLRKEFRKSLPLPLHLPNEQRLALYRAKARVKIDKAKNLLGYEPKFSFERGMELTAHYIKWANL